MSLNHICKTRTPSSKRAHRQTSTRRSTTDLSWLGFNDTFSGSRKRRPGSSTLVSKGKDLRPVTEKSGHGEGEIERLSQFSDNSQIRGQDLRSDHRQKKRF